MYSPLIFNLYSEEIFTEALENTDHEILLNVRYADDTVVIGLQELMNRMNMQK